MTEEWRPIPGYEGAYDVSDQGRVRSWLPSQGRTVPRLLKPGLSKCGGYPIVSLRTGSARGSKHVHRLVTLAFVGPKPAGMQVRHLNGDPLDSRLSNLLYGTPSENQRDKRRHGTDHNLNKTHCPRNHEYTDENTYRHPDGRRFCRECKRLRGIERITCDQCGVGLARSNKNAHVERHHSGRTPGRIYTREPIRHGTENGYAAHCRRNEPVPAGDPCGCRAAHAARVLERKQMKAAA